MWSTRRLPPPCTPQNRSLIPLNPVFHAFQDGLKVLEGGSIFKSPTRGIDQARTRWPSMISPTHVAYKRGPVRLEQAVSLQLRSSAQPPPSAGVLILREVLSISPARLLPPIPCIGHHLPPSPTGASFWQAPTDTLLTRRSLWPSKGKACRCLW